MRRKSVAMTDEVDKEVIEPVPLKETNKAEVENLNRLLAAVLNYLSNDEVEVIDIEYLLENTEGLQEWWDQYQVGSIPTQSNQIHNSKNTLLNEACFLLVCHQNYCSLPLN